MPQEDEPQKQDFFLITQNFEASIKNKEQAGFRLIDQGFDITGQLSPEFASIEAIHILISSLHRYLRGILATDTLIHHRRKDGPNSREVWRLNQSVLVRNIILRNRLSLNSFNQAIPAMEYFIEFLPIDVDLRNRIRLFLIKLREKVTQKKNVYTFQNNVDFKKWWLENRAQLENRPPPTITKGEKPTEPAVTIEILCEYCEYDTFPVEQKVMLVKELDQICIDLLTSMNLQIQSRDTIYYSNNDLTERRSTKAHV